MAGKKAYRTEDFRSPDATLSFAQNLFKPRAHEQGGTEKYGCTLIFDKKDEAVLLEKLKECIVGEWGEAGLERAKKGLIKSPILAGDGKEAHNKKTGELNPGMGADKIFVRCTALYEPKVIYRSQNVQATPEEVYSGCRGFGVLNAFAWSSSTGDGVSFGIQMFQKKGDGERIGGGGGVDVDKWAEKIDDAGEAPAETKSGAGAGGLFG